MRSWKSAMPLALLGLGSCIVDAMPTAENLHKLMAGPGHMDKRCPFADPQGQAKDDLTKRLFVDFMKAPIDITRDHAFQPPNFGNGDQRGPCPGLNALANHGYISRKGIVSLGEAAAAINKVYGMGVDLATILATMGTVWVGNPLSLDPGFSIGGKSSAMINLLGNVAGLLGQPQGLVGSHNFIEADSSNTRDDLYVTGDSATLNMTKFKEWYAMAEDGKFTMDIMAKRAQIRFEQSKTENPNFYYGPFTGMVARNAGYIFSGRFFANYSAKNPAGVLTKEIVRNFFAIYGDDDNLEYRKGWERIPENWYRIPVDYGLAQLNLDLLDWVSKYPELSSIGGNTGTVNSFAGIDLGDLTQGVFDSKTLLEKNNLLCLALEVVKLASPSALGSLYKTLAVPLDLIADATKLPLINFACPAFKDLQMGGQPFWDAAQNLFPGASKSAL